MGLFCMWADTVTITRLSRLPRPLWNSPLPDSSQVTAQLAELGKLEDNFATKFCYKAATKKPQQQNSYWGFLYGGERGIRTLDTLLTYTPLAGARLQPLGHFSKTFIPLLYL